MKKSMRDYKELTERLYPVPGRVQQLIPIYKIAEDGIFQLENKPEEAENLYDKAYLFLDTNFATMDDFEQEEFLKKYCILLNALNVSFKIILMNNNRNMDQVREEVFIHNADTRFFGLVQSFNEHMQRSMLEGHAGIEQVRIFILTCKRQSPDQARDFFRSIEANLSVNFNNLQSGLIPLNAAQRLRYLHAFYRLGSETKFEFDFHKSIQRGVDWKDIICPMAVKNYQDEYGSYDGITLQMDERYVRALYVPGLPSGINPSIIQKLTSGSYHVIITCDVSPVPQDATRKRLMDLYMQNERVIEKQQEARNKARAWSSTITYERRREKEELENYLDILNDNNEKMYYLGLYAILTADSKTELENAVTSFCSIAQGEGFQFIPARWQQIDTVNTALPIGVRFMDVMYPVFTQPLCAITPFVVHELFQPGGSFYGINQVSKNVLIGDRKKLTNGNGFCLGVPGGGKGMATKQEIVQVFLNTEDDIIIIDPQNEYRDIAAYLTGQFIDFGAESGHNLNPLDTETLEYMETKRAFLADKTDLMVSIFSRILDDEVKAQDKSIIGRCTRKVYEHVGEKGTKAPTLVDLYEAIEQEPETQAQELLLALELFVKGSLDMFAKPSNVDMNNRLLVFGTANLGKEQSGIGTLIILESIRARIAANAARGRATWLYIDEFHNLTDEEFSARYLEKIWKEVRKLGGLCTAITQNIKDAMSLKMVQTMLCNSEYICLLKQSEIEIEILSSVLGVSDNLLDYVHNTEPGCGLLKFGDRYIPFDGRLPKSSEMYKLFNTNFHEIQESKRASKKRIKGLRQEINTLPELAKEASNEAPTELEKAYQ